MSIPAYTIEPSRRCRSFSIHVYPTGNVIVRVPEQYDPVAVRQFVTAHTGWIENQQRQFSSEREGTMRYSVTIGDRVVPYTITYHNARKKISLLCHPDGRLEVRAPQGATADSVAAMIGRHKDWIRKNLRWNKKPNHPALAGRYAGSLEQKGNVIPYTVKISPRAKRIAIKVKQDRSVEVISPAGANRDQVRQLVERKADWIYKQVTSGERAVAVRRSFCDGEIYPFLGGTLTVRVTRGGERATAVRRGTVLEVCLPEGLPPEREQKAVLRAVEMIVRHESYRAALPRVKEYAAALGVSVPPVYVRKNKTKWGYCTSRGELTFASELCLLPPRLLDYVVAHECCHLVVMNHADSFWKTFRMVMPDCGIRQRELKRDAPLYRIFLD